MGAKLSPGWGSSAATWSSSCVLLFRPQGLFAKHGEDRLIRPMGPASVPDRARHASRAAPAWSGAGLVLIALVSLPAWGGPSTMRILVEFIALLVLAQMWNLLAGYAGLVSIGQQAYVGLGGYALIVLADDLGVEPVPRGPAGGAGGEALALPTASLVFRFRGGYFAVGTWAIAEVYRLLIANTARSAADRAGR